MDTRPVLAIKPPPFWTDNKVQQLRDLNEEGLTGSAIGRLLGCSRSAIGAKLRRLGIRSTTDEPAMREKRPRIVPDPTPAQAPSPDEPVSLNVTMMEVRDGMCRYIAGDPSQGATLCGNPTELANPYCPFHQARCYVPIKPYVPQELRG